MVNFKYAKLKVVFVDTFEKYKNAQYIDCRVFELKQKEHVQKRPLGS